MNILLKYQYIKSNGLCEAIEFFEPANLFFYGVCLIGKPYSEGESLFKSIDDETELDGSGLVSY